MTIVRFFVPLFLIFANTVITPPASGPLRTLLPASGKVLAVTGGYDFSLALMADHTIRAWGANAQGQLGDGSTSARLTPVTVSGLNNVLQVSAGWQHAVAVTKDGGVWTWGKNFTGQLGNNTTANSAIPIHVSGLGHVIAVSGGDCHTAALESNGTVWTWGCNDRGQLGDGTLTERHLPVQASNLSNVIAVSARDYPDIAIKSDGSVWTWGWNINGQLGDGTTITRTEPLQVLFFGAIPGSVTSIWGGARHCIVLKSDGTVWDWGMNWSGKLGDNTTSTFSPPWENGTNDRHSPIQVHGPEDVGFLNSITAIMGGEAHNFALKSDGTVWAWGSNMFGQLGDGTNIDRYTPVQVSNLGSVTALGGRGYHSLAITSDGNVWAWGLNGAGELGDGTTRNSNVPVEVIGLNLPIFLPYVTR
jgi:alpha-tubulin suppressor-like RCC1 family protein